MTLNDLWKIQPVQILERGSPLTEDVPHLVVYGIGNGSDHCTGICVGDMCLEREIVNPLSSEPRLESVDALVLRAMRDLAPTLPPDTRRDKYARPVAWLKYDGLPAEHCRPPV